jgi:hypothetical protein
MQSGQAFASQHLGVYDAQMRTTVDLPDDLHRVVVSLADHTRRSLSATAVELIRLGLLQSTGAAQPAMRQNPLTLLPVVSLGRPVTPDDVRALDDEG